MPTIGTLHIITCIVLALAVVATGFAVFTTNKIYRRLASLVLLCALVLQSLILAAYSRVTNDCPIYAIDQLLSFLAWSISLWYFILGSKYRLSLIGFSTAPFVLVLSLLALLFFQQPETATTTAKNFWLSMHASLALLAYGAWGLAAIAGFVFYLQNHTLLTGHPHSWAFRLPPLDNLTSSLRLLLGVGLGLLSLAIATALFMEKLPSNEKFFTIIFIWLVYLSIFICAIIGRLHSSRLAIIATLAFVLPLASLWIVRPQLQPSAPSSTTTNVN